MPITRPVHDDRERAESFGSVAENYDRYRPSYPNALIDDLAELMPPGERVLDVGCGTGKAAVLLAARGLSVLGVEVDARMAEVARRHGLEVEVAPFERWDDRGRRFGLVTCAQAWHWIDPVVGARRAADVLLPGGSLALFWNYGRPEPQVRAAMDEVYRGVDPELVDSAVNGGSRKNELSYADDLRASGRFASVEQRRYPLRLSYTTEEWLAVVQTHSDHLRMPPERRGRLIDGLRAVLDHFGGWVVQEGATELLLARRRR